MVKGSLAKLGQRKHTMDRLAELRAIRTAAKQAMREPEEWDAYTPALGAERAARELGTHPKNFFKSPLLEYVKPGRPASNGRGSFKIKLRGYEEETVVAFVRSGVFTIFLSGRDEDKALKGLQNVKDYPKLVKQIGHDIIEILKKELPKENGKKARLAELQAKRAAKPKLSRPQVLGAMQRAGLHAVKESGGIYAGMLNSVCGLRVWFTVEEPAKNGLGAHDRLPYVQCNGVVFVKTKAVGGWKQGRMAPAAGEWVHSTVENALDKCLKDIIFQCEDEIYRTPYARVNQAPYQEGMKIAGLRAKRAAAYPDVEDADKAIERADAITELVGESAKAMLQDINGDIYELTQQAKQVRRAWEKWDWDALENFNLISKKDLDFIREVRGAYTWDNKTAGLRAKRAAKPKLSRPQVLGAMQRAGLHAVKESGGIYAGMLNSVCGLRVWFTVEEPAKNGLGAHDHLPYVQCNGVVFVKTKAVGGWKQGRMAPAAGEWVHSTVENALDKCLKDIIFQCEDEIYRTPYARVNQAPYQEGMKIAGLRSLRVVPYGDPQHITANDFQEQVAKLSQPQGFGVATRSWPRPKMLTKMPLRSNAGSDTAGFVFIDCEYNTAFSPGDSKGPWFQFRVSKPSFSDKNLVWERPLRFEGNDKVTFDAFKHALVKEMRANDPG